MRPHAPVLLTLVTLLSVGCALGANLAKDGSGGAPGGDGDTSESFGAEEGDPESTVASATSSHASAAAGAGSTSASVTTGGAATACCNPSASPGCGEASVESCVCAVDDYCCATAWDATCVGLVDSEACGDCGGPVDPSTSSASSGGGVGATTASGGGGGLCCVPDVNPGCADPSIEACVCGTDLYCCLIEWDQLCVDEVAQFGCGTCAP